MRSIWTRSTSASQLRGQRGGEADAGGFGGDLELIDEVFDDLAEIEARFLEDELAGFGLREQEQGADDLREPVDILQGVEHGLAVLIGGLGGEEGDFELAADAGDGSAEFVRDVGGELADLLEAGLEALDHAVEGEDEVVELVAGVAGGNAQAEVGAGDALRGLGDGEHGGEGAAGHEVAEQGTENQRAGDDAGEDPGVAVQDLDVVGVGGADGDVVRRDVAFRIHNAAANLDRLAFGSLAIFPEDLGLVGGDGFGDLLANVGGLIDADIVVGGGNGGVVGFGIGNRDCRSGR